jgi:hypothetical protein
MSAEHHWKILRFRIICPEIPGTTPCEPAGAHRNRMGGHGYKSLRETDMPSRGDTGALGLSDAQLTAVMTAAGGLEVEKRSILLERVAARLRLRGPHFTDADLGVAIQAALTGLVQSAA